MESIRVNLPNLLHKTANIRVLIAHLYSEKVISLNERQLVNSGATEIDKNEKLYDILMTKGDGAFANIIACLKKSENEHIAITLEGKEMPGTASATMDHPVWFEIRRIAVNYVGRDSELEQLKNSWETSQNGKIQKINLISGLGGVGKSELCRVFVNDLHRQERVNFMWFNSETDGSLVESLKSLAASIKINIHDQTGNEKDVFVIMSDIFSFFRGKKAVFIYDNLETITVTFAMVLKEIEKTELLAPHEIKPFVIITSRFEILKHELSENVELIEVGVLNPTDALIFLTRALEIKDRDQDELLLELARRLQYFPLDLKQAVGFIQSENSKSMKLSRRFFGVREYLDLFDKERKDLLDFHAVSFGRLSPRSETTYINWRVAREGLVNHSQIGLISIQLMSAISFFSPDGISVPVLVDVIRCFLIKPSSQDVSTVFSSLQLRSGPNKSIGRRMIDEAISLCSEYSLFSLKNGVIYVHRLVQEVIRVELTNRSGLDKEVVSILVDCFEDKFKSESLPENCIQHAVQVWEHISIDKQLVDKHKYFPQWVFTQLKKDIKYTECTAFSGKAIDVLRSVLGEDEVTLGLMNSKCIVLVLNGKYEEAGIGYREVYERRKALLGDDHEDTLMSEFGIGNVLWYQEKYLEALTVLKNVVSIQERVLGKEHSHTLRTKSQIAGVFERQERFDEALLILRDIDGISERLLGKDHPETVAGKHNMALVLSNQRKYEEALQIYYEVNEINERCLGSEHPSTLIGKYNIALAHHEKGENSNALSLLRDVHEKRKRVLGFEHPHTVLTKTWIDKVDEVVNKIE